MSVYRDTCSPTLGRNHTNVRLLSDEVLHKWQCTETWAHPHREETTPVSLLSEEVYTVSSSHDGTSVPTLHEMTYSTFHLCAFC